MSARRCRESLLSYVVDDGAIRFYVVERVALADYVTRVTYDTGCASHHGMLHE